MIRLLISGFASIILGLNLMMIRYVLKIAPEIPLEIVNELTRAGSVVAIIGFTILAIGLIQGFRGKLSQETAVILLAGSSVVVIGISTIIGGLGRGNEAVIHGGAWVAVGIGVVLVTIYVIRRCRQMLKSKTKS